MKNQICMGLGFVVLILVCVGVIRYEAQQTRQAIRESASGAVRDGVSRSIENVTAPERIDHTLGKIESVLKSTQESAAKTLPDLAEATARTTKDVAGEMRGVITDVFGLGKTSEGAPTEAVGRAVGGIFDGIRSTVEGASDAGSPSPKPEGTPAPQPAKEKPAETGGDVPSGQNDPVNNNKSPTEMVDALFEAARRTTETGDKLGRQVFRLSADDERRWGKRLHEEVITDSKVVRDATVNQRMQRAAAPLLKTLLRPEIEYTFTVLQSDKDDLNAFSLPGGYVYVHSALIDFMQNDDELQFVLAHEVGHVDLGHCANKLTYAARVSDLTAPIVGQAVGALHNILSRSYAKYEEFDADHYAFAAAVAAGQTRERVLSFPRRFQKRMQERGDTASSKPNDQNLLGVLVDRTQNHFHTHPPIDERLKRLEAIDDQAIRTKAANARRDNAKSAESR